MSGPLLLVLTVLISYLIGAIPFGYLVARARGVDITRLGSGNIGATNVGRVLGKPLGILVFLLDFAKGALPAGVALAIARSETAFLIPLGSDLLPVTAGLASFLGHLFPVYLRFRGGKGVATGAGVVAVLLPVPALVALGGWLAMLCLSRAVSAASLTAVALLCLVRLVLVPGPFAGEHAILTWFCLVAAGLVVLRHRSNVVRLLQGTENRLQDTAGMLRLTRTIHVLAVGLWFGTMIFFTFVLGLQLIVALDHLTEPPAGEREIWLPMPAGFDRDPPSAYFPKPLQKEQGRRIFGAAVNVLFPWYFGIITVCNILAAATAWPWSRSFPEKIHRWRAAILLAALATVGVNWWLDAEVNSRRPTRSQASDAVLQALRDFPQAPEHLVQRADRARADFDRWHTFSLFGNFATLILATAAMAMAAQLPHGEPGAGTAETKLEQPGEP